jgi:GTP diphosphokinase / guanosine-3',5'-bis(diphosphate) 3'-diphosphatase
VIDHAAEKAEILRRYRGLLRSIRGERNAEDTRLIRKAFNIAVEAHKEQRRKTGEPYIYHPIAVARICAEEIGLGTTSVVAALLHDTVEDTDLTLEDVKDLFGPTVATIIDGLTKISGVHFTSDSMQAENFRKVLLTLAQDVRVILIKLADRLHNMRTLDSMARDKQLKIASETLYLYAPLAHRMGLYNIKSELEDLGAALQGTGDPRGHQPEAQEGRGRAQALHQPLHPAHPRGAGPRRVQLRDQGPAQERAQHLQQDAQEARGLRGGVRRLRHPHHHRQHAPNWRRPIAGRSIRSSRTSTSPTRTGCAIGSACPKANGYESLHTTVMSPGGRWVEVQIRSRRMDEVAEMGLAAHYRYKDGEEQASAWTLG